MPVVESPTVCTPTHDSDDDNPSLDSEGDYNVANDICDRAPFIQCIVDRLKDTKMIVVTINQSPIFVSAGRDILFNPEL